MKERKREKALILCTIHEKFSICNFFVNSNPNDASNSIEVYSYSAENDLYRQTRVKWPHPRNTSHVHGKMPSPPTHRPKFAVADTFDCCKVSRCKSSWCIFHASVWFWTVDSSLFSSYLFLLFGTLFSRAVVLSEHFIFFLKFDWFWEHFLGNQPTCIDLEPSIHSDHMLWVYLL